MAKYLQNFPPGPLDKYRKLASFDWKKMKIFLDSEDYIEYQYELIEELMKSPDFQSNNTETLNDIRCLSMKRLFTLRNCPLLHPLKVFENPKYMTATQNVLFTLDGATFIKLSVSYQMFPGVIQILGTKRHIPILEDIFAHKIVGCFCLTEIGHGSNLKALQTRVTYDTKAKEFVIHSPNFEAAKCWAGGLGQIATYGVIYAQLITPDGTQQGLHAFVVPLRNPNTMLPYPGVIIGDMGEKIGLNEVDNGFVMFNNYRIPRESLLNRNGDVLEDGTYVAPYKDPNKTHGATFGALSFGRVAITNMCSIYATKGITIAMRYAAVRKQFGPGDAEEVPILEYQTHQHRLIPHLATTFCLNVFGRYLTEIQTKMSIDSMMGEAASPELRAEIHIVASSSKPVASWTSRDILQECREACAGHGYLKASGLGSLRNDNDANTTYEGENHVLIQQTSNWLIKQWPEILKGQKFSSPMHSTDFLSDALKILQTKLEARNYEEIITPDNIFHMYDWLTCYLLKASYENYESNVKQYMDSFTAKNENQVFYARNLSIAFVQRFILQVTYNKIKESNDSSLTNVLFKLFSLYGLHSIERHLSTLYQGGFIEGATAANLIQHAILQLVKYLKDDAIALVDAIAPPDIIMDSVLGKSDGEVYKHLQEKLFNDSSFMSRPTWWKEFIKRRMSKL